MSDVSLSEAHFFSVAIVLLYEIFRYSARPWLIRGDGIKISCGTFSVRTTYVRLFRRLFIFET